MIRSSLAAGEESASHAGQVRQRILEGATRAFARSGLQGTSVPDIATECGISVGLLYRYFASKAELYTAICTAQTMAEAEGLRLQLAEISDPELWLDHAIDFYLNRLSADGGASLLLGAMAEAGGNPVVRRSLQLRQQLIGDFIRSFIRTRIGAGRLPPEVPLEDYAKGISMLLDGAVAEWAVAGPDFDFEAVRRAIRELVNVLLKSVSSQEPAPAAASA
ncbi:MAG: TetR/AcrR family transcriptional regulator [Candidatus Dormibacteria bacterium]